MKASPPEKRKRGLSASDSSPATVGFRLNPEHGCILAGRASALGVSPHELARRYLIEVLEEAEERAALRQAVTTLNGNLLKFRDEFIFALEAVLASAGKVERADVRAWIDEHFK
jgi:hypothetical protein